MKLSRIYPVFLVLFTVSVPLWGNEPRFNRFNFLNDPSLPFSNYTDKGQLVADFNEGFADEYDLLYDSKLDEQAKNLIDKTYAAFVSLYPRFMANKAKPDVLVVKGEGLDLTAYMPQKYRDNHRGFVIVTDSLLNSAQSMAAKIGLAAHEISHLFLWHQDANLGPIRVYYSGKKLITRAETDAFSDWFVIAGLIGWLTQSQSNGINLDSSLGAGFGTFIKRVGEIPSSHCGKPLVDKLVEKRVAMSKFMSRYQWDFIFDTPEKLKALDEVTRSTIQLIEKCSNSEKITITEYDLYILNAAGIKVAPSDAEVTFKRFLEINRDGQARLRDLEKHFDKNQLRFYSVEDQADEVAMTILKHLGYRTRDYPESFLDFLYDDRSLCVQNLQKGIEPPYGNLIDDHHAPCWRIYNLNKFIQSNDRLPLLN